MSEPHATLPGDGPQPLHLFSLAKVCRVLHRLQRYTLAGGVATALHWSLMVGLVCASVDPWLASSVGAVAGSLVSYRLQCRFVFRQRAGGRRLLRYMAALTLAMGGNLALLFALPHGDVALVPAQCIATVAVGILNFAVLQSWVFGRKAAASVSVR